jgi:hypothetical protein
MRPRTSALEGRTAARRGVSAAARRAGRRRRLARCDRRGCRSTRVPGCSGRRRLGVWRRRSGTTGRRSATRTSNGRRARRPGRHCWGLRRQRRTRRRRAPRRKETRRPLPGHARRAGPPRRPLVASGCGVSPAFDRGWSPLPLVPDALLPSLLRGLLFPVAFSDDGGRFFAGLATFRAPARAATSSSCRCNAPIMRPSDSAERMISEWPFGFGVTGATGLGLRFTPPLFCLGIPSSSSQPQRPAVEIFQGTCQEGGETGPIL